MDDPTKQNRDLNWLYPDLRVRYFKLCEEMKNHYKPIFITDGFRTFERQAWIHKTQATVQSALPGDSWHNYGLAFDVAFYGANPYAETNPWEDLRRMAVMHGLEPISKFNTKGELIGDRPHFQIRYGLSLDEVKNLFKVNGIVSVWAKIDLMRNIQPGDQWFGPQLGG